jgi:hypothetical protein
VPSLLSTSIYRGKWPRIAIRAKQFTKGLKGHAVVRAAPDLREEGGEGIEIIHLEQILVDGSQELEMMGK